jgi:hypothetical protein
LIASYTEELIFQEGDSYENGEIEETIYQAARDLNVGEFSSAVAGEDGIYLIRRIEDTPSLMAKKREEALFGATDQNGIFHPGAYDRKFFSLYQTKAKEIKIRYGKDWERITTKSVF